MKFLSKRAGQEILELLAYYLLPSGYVNKEQRNKLRNCRLYILLKQGGGKKRGWICILKLSCTNIPFAINS